MAVQILGLREYICPKTGKPKKAERFFEKNWRATSVKELFANLSDHLKEIPEEEHYNLYYTAGSCKEQKGRKLDVQNVIPFDIDDIDDTKISETVDCVIKELHVKHHEVGIVFSGNGLQIIIGIKEPFSNEGYFDEHRAIYKAVCGKINQSLYIAGLSGHADTSVFSMGRLLRLPNTRNIKKNKGTKESTLIQHNIEYGDFDMYKITNIPKLEEGEYVHPKALLKLPDPDTAGVLGGCDFLKHCIENQATIDEPSWYAMLSIVGRLKEGSKLVHEFSKNHPDYSPEETDDKMRYALDAAGPRTCDNITSLWDGCNTCANYNKCKSPIMLRTESFIKTLHTGFYEVAIGKDGQEKRGKPSYDDLAKHFENTNPYTTMEQGNIVHTFDGQKWVDISRNRIHNFAEKSFDPTPTNGMCMEFEAKLKRTQLRDPDWYHVEGLVNFENGVLDLNTMTLVDSSPDHGFKYVLPFEFDPLASCPRFEQFLQEVTLGQSELSNVLIEFMGYALLGIDPAVGQKALILHGEGSNGKSVFIEVLRLLAGKNNYSTLSMGHEINKLENRYQLSGKLFNVSEETPSGAMMDSSIFKALVSGGEVQARKLYCDSYSMKNYAKIIMACNTLPTINDLSHGMIRRLLIVPFDALFDATNRDVHLLDKLKKELSGIFNRAVTGRDRFIKNGDMFSESKQMDDVVEEYVENNDSILTWMIENCGKAEEMFSTTVELFDDYAMYCDRSKIKPLNKIQFSKRVAKHLEIRYKKDCKTRQRKDNRLQRGFIGIGLANKNF
jgi:putative DNA primase/helicase